MDRKGFNLLVDNIEVVKANYIRFLSPFFNRKMIIEYKTFIYSYQVAEWKKDKVWEFLNGDIEDIVFYEIANHLKK